MNVKVYLAGNISSNPETYEWREVATQLLTPYYEVLNPSSNPFNTALLKEFTGDIESFKVAAINRAQHILLVKDYNLVLSANIILANMALVTPGKPLIGTLFELAWAWQLRKPVIAIVGDNWYCKHPFPTSTFAATANSVEDACMLIHEFFKV